MRRLVFHLFEVRSLPFSIDLFVEQLQAVVDDRQGRSELMADIPDEIR